MTADGSDRSFGAPRFDVVLRGYDRRQVDEHISRLQRLMGRMRNDLDASRGQPLPPTGPPTPAGGRMRPTPRPRPDGQPATGANDVVGSFTDRMHAILQAAEEEAAEIRGKARAAVRAEEERAGGVRASARAEEEAGAPQPRGSGAPARRGAGRAHPRAWSAGGPAVRPDHADHAAHPGEQAGPARGGRRPAAARDARACHRRPDAAHGERCGTGSAAVRRVAPEGRTRLRPNAPPS